MTAQTVRKPLVTRIMWPGKKEATYGAAISDGEAGTVVTTFDGTLVKETGAFQRSGQVGRGHEWDEANRFNNGWDASVSYTEELHGDLAGWLGAMGLGAVTSSSSGGAYLHVCKPVPVATTTQIPSTTLVQKQADEGLEVKYSGMAINEFTISGQKGTGTDSWLKASYSMIGSGAVTSGSGVATPSMTPTTPMLFSNIQVMTMGASGALNAIDRLTSFSFKHSNNLQGDKGYLAGSTLVDSAPVRQRLEMGDRRGSAMLELTFERTRSAYTERTNFRAGTSWAITLTCRGKLITGSTYETWKLTIPVAKVDAYEPDWDDVLGIAKVSLMPEYDAGIAAPFKIEVNNNRSSYLTGA